LALEIHSIVIANSYYFPIANCMLAAVVAEKTVAAAMRIAVAVAVAIGIDFVDSIAALKTAADAETMAAQTERDKTMIAVYSYSERSMVDLFPYFDHYHQ